MALVTLSGLPSSGRSTRSQALKHEFEQRIKQSADQTINRVVIVSDQDVHVPKSAYSSQRTEKPARASYLSAVTRALGRDTIVIADGGAGLNIKGFRYQLWCAAREVGVRCLTVHVHAPPVLCRFWNTSRRISEGESASYDDETIDSLFMRYEEPNPMTRWDSPLFLVPSTLAQESAGEDAVDASKVVVDPLPVDELWEAATKGAVKKAPEVVAPTRSTTSNYLSLLESSTQAVLTLVLEHQASLGFQPGASIPLSSPALAGPTPLALTIPADKAPTLASLQRLRRQFVRMHSAASAAVTELGIAARNEGAQFPLNQHAPSASPEWLIAKRLVAFLEEAL